MGRGREMQAVDDASCQKLQSRYLQYLPALFRRELVVNVAARKAWVAGDEVSMSEQEFDLLAFLYERQGTELSADEIAKLAVVRPQNGTPPDESEIKRAAETAREISAARKKIIEKRGPVEPQPATSFEKFLKTKKSSPDVRLNSGMIGITTPNAPQSTHDSS